MLLFLLPDAGAEPLPRRGRGRPSVTSKGHLRSSLGLRRRLLCPASCDSRLIFAGPLGRCPGTGSASCRPGPIVAGRMQPSVAPASTEPLTMLDPAEHFTKRKKTSLWFTVALLVVSVFILTIGLAATTRTENVTVGGYYPGIILGFGSFLGIIGLHLVENRKQMLIASIVFISFGVVAAFCCAIVDGVFAARHIEPRPLYTKRCQYYTSGIGYLFDAYQTEVTCYALNNKCQLKVKSNTCYCCDLYNCENSEHSTSYYEFLGVSSCQDVVHLYRLLWSSTVLNIIGLFLGIITAAILGAFKDVVPVSQIAFSSAPPPQILYNPAQQILTYAGFCPSATSVPHYPSYHLPLQPTGNFPTSSSTDVSLVDDPQPPSQASCNHGVPPNAPPLYTPAYFLSGEKPPPCSNISAESHLPSSSFFIGTQ